MICLWPIFAIDTGGSQHDDLPREGHMSGIKIAIVTDSSAHIPDELMRGLDIHVIPVWLIWDNESFRDGIDIQPEEFYYRLRS